MKNIIIFASLSLLLLSACKEQTKFKILPQGPIQHQLIVAAKTATSVRVRGFAGATPAGTNVYFEVGTAHASVVSNPNGSFNFELPHADLSVSNGEFNFTMPDKKHTRERYELKNLSEALSLVAHEALNTVPEISFVRIQNNEAFILSEEKAFLRRIPINSDWTLATDAREDILLNPHINESPSPQMVDARKHHAVVSLFNSGELSLVELSTNKLINNFKLPHNQTNSAQSVLVLDDTNYLVSFVNFKQNPQDKSYTYGPGVLALVEIKNNALQLNQTLILPSCKNPYDLKAKNSQELWVSCRGGENISDAALIKLNVSSDMKDIKIIHTQKLDNFAPGEFEIIGDTLVIPELWGNRLLVLKENNMNIQAIEAQYSRKFNFTTATHWHEDIVMLGDANGALVAYSLSEGFFPFPFSEPINITKQPNPQIPFVPNQIIMRHASTNNKLDLDYPVGFSAWVVLHRQNQIIPLDFLKIFGP